MALHARYTIDCDAVTPGFTGAYLRVSGDECAIIETYTSHAVPRLLDTLAAHGLHPHDVRWVVVTHAHLDHAAGASAVLAACPHATLLAHPRAARALIDPSRLIASATAVYGPARFAALYGTVEPIPAARVRSLADGETFSLGSDTLQVLHTAGHANHHMVVDDPATGTVFTGDAFGLVYPRLQHRGRFAIPSTSPTGFDAVEARRSIARIRGLHARTASLTHWGEVADVDAVGEQLLAWIDRAEAWVDEAARGDESLAALTARLTVAWRQAVVAHARERSLGWGAAEMDLLALDIELNAQGLAVAADARRRGRT